MEFNALLRIADLRPGEVSLVLHKPGDQRTRNMLATLIEAQPHLFEAYQSTHPRIQEATIKSRPYVASFLMRDPAELAFLGLYEVLNWTPAGSAQLHQDPTFREMFGLVNDVPAEELGDTIRAGFADRVQFNLRPMERLKALARRLVVVDPGGRNYVRLADTTDLPILEVRRTARISPPVPAWDDLVINAPDLKTLPRDWISTLSNWRGIYLIVDQVDGARYVGAAYGAENLYGRWRAHVAPETGITVGMRSRPTSAFRFSILELLAPTAELEDVVKRERSWMRRLDTIASGLNA